MLKRICAPLCALAIAASVSAPAVDAFAAGPPPPPPAVAGAPVALVPIACTFILPLLMSISLQRELSGEELTSTTLICFTGPLGYYIATENGWIGPEFFQGGGS